LVDCVEDWRWCKGEGGGGRDWWGAFAWSLMALNDRDALSLPLPTATGMLLLLLLPVLLQLRRLEQAVRAVILPVVSRSIWVGVVSAMHHFLAGSLVTVRLFGAPAIIIYAHS
jgi:hypothetical protein